MARITWFVAACAVICTGMAYGVNTVVTGEIVESDHVQRPVSVVLPDGFDVEAASAALREARWAGDQERVQELTAQLTAWQNSLELPLYPDAHGYNTEPPVWDMEDENHHNNSPDWGNDVRIAPEDHVRDVKIASLSNGHLYTVAFRVESSIYYAMIHRSTNNGLTWSQYWNNAFSTGTSISSVGITSVNDTLLIWYVLQNSSNEYRTWSIAALPGATFNAIYYGSPTGGFNPVQYTNLHMTSDAPIYGTGEYVYATWSERYGTGPDSTRVMAAGSYSIDVTAWEIGPTKLDNSAGANIYYTGTKIAYGSDTDRMWVICWLHPYNYPTSYDRTVKGWYSTNYGSTWSTRVDITPNNNGLDEYTPAVAGSHSNTNWVVLATQDTVTTGVNRDVNCWYSTDDGSTWTYIAWITNYDNWLPDVWVDDGSHAFYGACRSNTGSAQHVRYKPGLITNPASWSGSVIVNDNTTNVSNVYGPSVSRNMGNTDAVLAWTDYAGAVYAIWFDSYSWTGIAEGETGIPEKSLMGPAYPNPFVSATRFSYAIPGSGVVTVRAYNALGQQVATLVDEHKPAGTYTVTWNGKDSQGYDLARGVYFVKLEYGNETVTRKLILE